MLGFQASNFPPPGRNTSTRCFPRQLSCTPAPSSLPVYWEQFEATPGHYDYSVVDAMLAQARGHHVRLVLLWFGTWKNGSSHYTPQWIKQDQQKYPFLVNKDGDTVDSPSTYSPARLEADKRAFAALMRHLRSVDPQRTVVMVQVENEAGVWGGIRDYRPEAEKDFAGPVPQKLVDALGKQAGTWKQVFGDAADETFQAWRIATYIEQIAAAGKAEYSLPLYTNAALRDPINPGRPGSYESGAPTDQNIQLYKTAAPSLALIAPDIYMPEYAKYMAVIDQYKRFDNPLLIPETGNAPIYAHYVFAAVGTVGPSALRRSVWISPSIQTSPKAPRRWEIKLRRALKAALHRSPTSTRCSSPSPAGWHRPISTETFAARAKIRTRIRRRLDFPRWRVVLSYGLPAFGNWIKPKGNTPPDGGAVIVALGPDEFLVAGHHVRVDFTPAFDKTKKRLFLAVEEGAYDAAGKWQRKRIWNGDQTDYGLNLNASAGYLLKVKLSTY